MKNIEVCQKCKQFNILNGRWSIQSTLDYRKKWALFKMSDEGLSVFCCNEKIMHGNIESFKNMEIDECEMKFEQIILTQEEKIK